METPLPKILTPITAPLSLAYTTAIRTRNFAYDKISKMSRKLTHPTISIGGIRAGGVGKTPVARMIGRYLIDNCNTAVAYLSRGYGRESSAKTVVLPPCEKMSGEKINWQEIGDEPWMLRENVPEAWFGIDADRVRAAVAISPRLPRRAVFVLDDGFQHRRARRDLDIVCLGESTFDDRPLPHGYLREPVSALARAHIALIIGAEDRLGELEKVRERVCELRKNSIKTAILLQHAPYFKEARSGKIEKKLPLASPAVVTGIARPERFLAMISEHGVNPAAVKKFKDHHKFKFFDFNLENDIYLRNGVLTTEKDAVRLLGGEFSAIPEIWYLKLELKFADNDENFLDEIHYIIK